MLKVWSVSILGGKPKQSPSHTQIIAKHPTCVLALLPKVGTTQIKAAQRPAQCFQCGNQLTKTIACCYHMTSASASINKPLKRSKIQNVDTREQLTSTILCNCMNQNLSQFGYLLLSSSAKQIQKVRAPFRSQYCFKLCWKSASGSTVIKDWIPRDSNKTSHQQKPLSEQFFILRCSLGLSVTSSWTHWAARANQPRAKRNFGSNIRRQSSGTATKLFAIILHLFILNSFLFFALFIVIGKHLRIFISSVSCTLALLQQGLLHLVLGHDN